MKCNRTDCPNEATHVAVLELRESLNGATATSTPIVQVCDDHKDVAWDDVVGPQGWVEICRHFEASGYVKPRKKFSNVKVISLAEYRKGMN